VCAYLAFLIVTTLTRHTKMLYQMEIEYLTRVVLILFGVVSDINFRVEVDHWIHSELTFSKIRLTMER